MNPELTDGECDDALDDLVAGSEKLGVPFDDLARTRFLRYCSLLESTNRQMNLTALREPRQIMSRLFLDSLRLSRPVREVLSPREGTIRLVDVGTGAGVPGLPLKIVHPEWSITLIESIAKKARFVQSVARELGLDQVTVLTSRAEEVGRVGEYRDQADLCVARAVASLPTLLELCAPLVRSGGVLALPRGADAEAEVGSARVASGELKLQLLAIQDQSTPSEDSAGGLILLYRKVAPTPSAYPRGVGVPKSRPLGVPVVRSGVPRARQSRPE